MIYVDNREPPKIFNLMKKTGVEFEIKNLQVGDFLKGNVCVERKSMEDYITSFQSGHLQKQLMQMEENYERPYLIISGSREKLAFSPHFKHWTVNRHNGSLAHLIRYKKLKVFQVPNDNQLVDLVCRIMEKSFDGKVVTIMDTELLRDSIYSEDIKLRMLYAIPGIGFEKAQVLRDKVNILILNKDCDIAKVKDIAAIPGFGEATAKKVLSIHLLMPRTKQEVRKILAKGIHYKS